MEEITKRQLPPPLPLELIENILKRLPVESLIQASCVCRLWRSLILRDSGFSKAHTDHVKRSSWVIPQINYSDTLKRLLSLRTIDCDGKVTTLDLLDSVTCRTIESSRILGSCNGLLLVTFSGISKVCLWKQRHYVLWNPYTNLIKRMDGFFGDYCTISGLSYDRETDVYKAIVVEKRYLKGEVKFFPRMFSLRRSKYIWELLDTNDFRFSDYAFERGALPSVGITVDGICHWMVYGGSGARRAHGWRPTTGVICFDPVMEKFRAVPLLDIFVDGKSRFEIGGLDGFLCLTPYNGPDFTIWRMKQHGVRSSWDVLYKFGFNKFRGMGSVRRLKILGYSSKGEVVMMEPGRSYWILVDVDKGTTRELSHDKLVPYNVGSPYCENLSCPWLRQFN